MPLPGTQAALALVIAAKLLQPSLTEYPKKTKYTVTPGADKGDAITHTTALEDQQMPAYVAKTIAKAVAEAVITHLTVTASVASVSLETGGAPTAGTTSSPPVPVSGVGRIV